MQPTVKAALPDTPARRLLFGCKQNMERTRKMNSEIQCGGDFR
jgi:hypothetical protein